MRIFTLALLFTWAASAIAAQEFCNIEYLCADWGPAMTLPAKKGEQPQFDDSHDEIYFLKQVGSFTRKTLPVPDPFSNKTTEDAGHGISIYLCKMKADGSQKTEVKELWHNPAYPIDTQTQSTWMSICAKTRKLALSVTYAGSDLTGLWTVNLDGTSLNRVITPAVTNSHLQAIDSPSWTTDGKRIVFGESFRGGERHGRIAKYDLQSTNQTYLSDGPGDCQPRVSPDDKMVAYVHIGDAKTGGLCLMGIDGANPHLLPNPDNKRNGKHSGTYPAWSPDGKSIYLIGTAALICDAATGKTIWERTTDEHRPSWYQWGKNGLVGFNVGGIVVSDTKTLKTSIVAASHQSKCEGKSLGDCGW